MVPAPAAAVPLRAHAPVPGVIAFAATAVILFPVSRPASHLRGSFPLSSAALLLRLPGFSNAVDTSYSHN